MGAWGKLRAQTHAEAKGAEIEHSDEQAWAVNPRSAWPHSSLQTDLATFHQDDKQLNDRDTRLMTCLL